MASTRRLSMTLGPEQGAHRVARLADNVDAALPGVRDDLDSLLRIPSISGSQEHHKDVVRSARTVAELLVRVGLDVEVVDVDANPTVIAHRAGPSDAPAVLLYAHHDIGPAPPAASWTSPPFEPTVRDGRLFARGAGGKSGLAVHLAALLAHGRRPPFGVTVVVDGGRHVGSTTLPTTIASSCERISADAMVLVGAENWAVGVPSLAVSARGRLDLIVEVGTLERTLDADDWTGPVPDALVALVATLGSLWTSDGRVAVDGLVSVSRPSEVRYDQVRFREQAGLLPGVRLVGGPEITDGLWYRPAVRISSIEVPAQATESAFAATARADVSVRLAPGDDPPRALAALTRHLRANVPHGAQLSVSSSAAVPPVLLHSSSALHRAALISLRAAWPVAAPAPATVGHAGSLPAAAALRTAFPHADLVITGVADPESRLNGVDESVHLDSLRNACVAEAVLLDLLTR